MFAFIVPALFEVISYCAGHPDVIEKLFADIKALAHGHPVNAAQDATIALQAGIAAAKASAVVTVQGRLAAGAKAAGEAVATHVQLTGDGA